jgi:hypothetical protein
LDQAGAQSHELALPAAQGAHRSLHVGFAEAEDLETTTHLALEAGSSQFCEAPQEPPVALQHPLHPAQVRGHLGRAELRFASVELPLEFRDLRTRRADHLGWCTVVANDVLGKVGRAQPPAPGHLSPIYLLRTSEDAQQSEFARAVAAYEADPRTRSHLHPQAAQQGPSPVEFLDGAELDQGHAALLCVFLRRIPNAALVQAPFTG